MPIMRLAKRNLFLFRWRLHNAAVAVSSSGCMVRHSSESGVSSTDSTLQVSEMFASLQGEGPHAGRPSTFLRLGACNLSCAWCDTPYTWLFSEDRLQKVLKNGGGHVEAGLAAGTLKVYDKKAELTKMSVSNVFDAVRDLASPETRAVVITGGEPLLHAKPLGDLVPMLLDNGYDVEFETNGTIAPSGLSDTVHFNVSPKLSNSGMNVSRRLNFGVLSELMARSRSILKFVVDSEEDIAEVHDIVNKLRVAHSRVYLMAQGKTSRALREKGILVANLCRANGFNYSHRLHVELWGDARGT